MGSITLPNQRIWTRVFKEIFGELDKKELSPHAKLLFGQEYKVHQIHATSWLKCRKCGKKWHSFKGSVEFTYGLKKEGKPKKRLGKVSLFPYGQQCKQCVEKALGELKQEKVRNEASSADENEITDGDTVDEVLFTDEPFWLPYFDEKTIRETLLKVYEMVVEKFYDKTDTSFTNRSYYKTRPSSSRSLSQSSSMRSLNRPDFGSQAGYAGSLPNIIYYHDGINQPQDHLQSFGHQNVAQQLYQPSNTMYPFMTRVLPQGDEGDTKATDDDGESIIGSTVGNGPHKSELCEACKKGKCNYKKNEDDDESGRQSRRGSEQSRIAKPPSFDDGMPDDVNSTNKVRWFLKFEEL